MSPTNEVNWRYWGKFTAIAFGILLVILILVQLFFTVFVESYLKTKIESSLSNPKKQLTAHVNNLELSTLRRQIEIQGLSVTHDSTLQSDTTLTPSPIDSIYVQAVSINGIHIFPYLLHHKLVLNDFIINKPAVKLVKRSTSSKDTSGASHKNSKQAIFEAMKSAVHSISIDHFALKHIEGSIRSQDEDTAFARIHNFSFRSSGIKIDSSWAHQKSMLPTQDFSGTVDSLDWSVNPKLYNLRTSDISFSNQDSSLRVNGINLIPKLPQYKFSQTVGHQVDRIHLSLQKLTMSGLDFASLIDSQMVSATSMQFSDGKLNIFHNKKLPRGPEKRKKMYHVAFRQMNTPVTVDSVLISDLDIRYTEHKENIPAPGYVTFENTSAEIKHLDNTSAQNTIIMHAQSDVMGQGHLNANFSFPPNKYGTNYLDATVSQMPIKALNPTLKYLASIRVESGVIHSLSFNMELGPQQSNGKVMLNYSNLKLSLIKFKDGDETEKKSIKSFLANTFVVKKNNKPPLRKGDISFDRITTKSLFNYWWKSLLTGLKSSVGL